MNRLTFGTIHADYITMDSAIERIVEMVNNKSGGYVVTPNVDHVVQAEDNPELRNAYADASLSLVDGMPLFMMSKLLGAPLPEKISGSDLIEPLMRRIHGTGISVYILGSTESRCQRAIDTISERYTDINIVGFDSSMILLDKQNSQDDAVKRISELKPDIVLLALGAPKQEILMHRWYKAGLASVMIGIGAGIDFISGDVKRSPRWISKIGFEWMFRLVQEPRRLARRYLVRDRRIIRIFFQMLRNKLRERK